MSDRPDEYPEVNPVDGAGGPPTSEWPMPDEGATTVNPVVPAEPTTATFEPDPWYKKPAVIVGGIVVLIAAAVGAFFLFANDDDGPNLINELTITRIDENGDPLVRTMVGAVAGPSEARGEFLWLSPPNAFAPAPAEGTTSESDGRITFRWTPTDNVADPTLWLSTIEVTEQLPQDFTLASAVFDCVLSRSDQANSAILLRAEVTVDPVSGLATVLYSFDVFEFIPGDTVTCTAGDNTTPTTTTSTTTIAETTTTTTVPETTTTVPETTTTVPETTTTIAATTTLAPATTAAPVPATTTTTVAAPETALEVIDRRLDLADFRALIDTAQLRATLEDPSAVYTIFAPNNAAFDALLASAAPPDLTDPTVARTIVLTQLTQGAALSGADVLAAASITDANGVAHAIDAGATPPTIGGAGIIETDLTTGGNALHVLDAVIPSTP